MSAASSQVVRMSRVRYGKVEAVHDVSLEVAAGSIVTVIGPNGAGKTTLLAAIMGLLPAAGASRLRRRGARRRSVEERVARRARAGAGEARAVRLDDASRTTWRSARFRTRAARRATTRLDDVYARFPRLARAPRAARRDAVGRRAADAGARPRADGEAAAADARRAEPRPRAADRAGDLRDRRRLCARPACRSCWSSRTRARRCKRRPRLCDGDGRRHPAGPAAVLAQDPRIIESYLGVGRAA